MAEDFFKVLRKKLVTPPGEGFDRQFWAKFEREFGGHAVDVPSWLDRLAEVWQGALWVPVTASLAIVAVIGAREYAHRSELASLQSEGALAEQILGDEELLRESEMLAEMDGAGITVDLSDEDWEVLLGDDEGEEGHHES